MKKIYKIVLIALSISLLISGCGLESIIQENNKEDKKIDYVIIEKGEISLPLTPIKTLNPVYLNNIYYYHFSKLVFESLFAYNESLEPIPQLAATYSIENDGKTLNIVLRDDVNWHNGEKLTSEDVVFTINTLKSAGPNSVYYKLLETVANTNDTSLITAKSIDNTHLKISLKYPISNALDLLTFPIIYRGLGKKAQSIDDYEVIGTGPYKFNTLIKNKEIKLKANENYRNGEPKITNIRGIILDDEELIQIALETGKINLAKTTSIDWDKYLHNPKFDFKEFVSENFHALMYSKQSQKLQGQSGWYIRKAIMYGINKEDIVRKAYLGHATTVDTPIHPSSYIFTEQSRMYGYSLEHANSNLIKAGYINKNENGIRINEEGEALRLTLALNKNSTNQTKVVELIKEDLRALGIELQTIELEADEGKGFKENISIMTDKAEYDLFFLDANISTCPSYEFLPVPNNDVELSKLETETEAKAPLQPYTGPSFTDNYEGMLLEYSILQERIANELPLIALLYTNKAILIDSNIKGELTPNIYNYYLGLEKCYLTSVPD